MFQKELEGLINKYSLENFSDTPDFVLAQYLQNSLNAYIQAVTNRDKWYESVKNSVSGQRALEIGTEAGWDVVSDKVPNCCESNCECEKSMD